VATAAVAALMSITIDNECKAEATRARAVHALAPLLSTAVDTEAQGGLNYTNCTLTANATKCVANLAEHPEGRKQLKKMALLDIKPLAESSEELLQKHASIAVARVEWAP